MLKGGQKHEDRPRDNIRQNSYAYILHPYTPLYGGDSNGVCTQEGTEEVD